jgi:hypothetical protein|tara:strand:- start:117 stop:413 length:297 start_codon:yes stop_codon:yes gene_type:complete
MVGLACMISMALAMLIPFSRPAGSVEAEDKITQLCLAGFQTAMAQAGKVPPAGMGQFTCDCFFKEVNKGESIQWGSLLSTIESAQETCKQRAAERFKL